MPETDLICLTYIFPAYAGNKALNHSVQITDFTNYKQ